MLASFALTACSAGPVREPVYSCYLYQGDAVRPSSCADLLGGWTPIEANELCSDPTWVLNDVGCYEIGTVARCTVVLPDGRVLVETYYLPWTTQDALATCEGYGGAFEVP